MPSPWLIVLRQFLPTVTQAVWYQKSPFLSIRRWRNRAKSGIEENKTLGFDE
jgi:hypothetical protein